MRDELADHRHLPRDGTRVEVIGGETVVSPGPTVDHNGMVFERGVFAEELTDETFQLRSAQTTGLNLFGEPIRLPRPFGYDTLTDRWEPWDA